MNYKKIFQYYLSSIKSLTDIVPEREATLFQYYLSSIKSHVSERD